MRISGDRKIRISSGETLTLRSNTARLNVLGKEIPEGQEFAFAVPPGPKAIQFRAVSPDISELMIRSSTGEDWATTLFPGSNLFEVVVEPEADEWYCENDKGNPPHPVSKGDSVCAYCGGTVKHR